MRDSETRRGEAPQYEAMAASTAARGDALESAPVHPGYTTDSNSYISLIGKDGCVQPHSSLVRRRGQAQGHGRLWMGKRCGASTVYQRPARGSLAHTALWGALTLLVLAPLSSAHQPCPPPPAPSSASATSTAQSQSQGLRGNLIPGPQVTAPAPAPEPLFCETLIQKLSVCPLPATEDSVNVDKYLVSPSSPDSGAHPFLPYHTVRTEHIVQRLLPCCCLSPSIAAMMVTQRT